MFFPVVTILYYVLPFKFRWAFLLVASYYFYMNWEPVYGLLLLFSTAVTFVCARQIDTPAASKKTKKTWITISLVLNFAVLAFFKYFNFLTHSITDLMESLGIGIAIPLSPFLLPVGISFYIFQAVGYTIDVYRKKVEAQRHFGKYALFVSYFPQLVAGPIERSQNLLPQFDHHHTFKFVNFWRGLRLMIIGFFMKLVVADRLSIYVDAVYNNSDKHSSYSLILATVFFSFQIYCDFAGYSAIAIGAARMMGYKLMTNFRRPYLSRSIGQFWRRWHISLSTWFKDYLYISLGGNRVSTGRLYLNLLITFTISGLWHGANWTFIVWGALNGCYLVAENFARSKNLTAKPGRLISVVEVAYVFLLINLAWVFFRSATIGQAVSILSEIVHFKGPLFVPPDPETMIYAAIGIGILLAMEIVYELSPRPKSVSRHTIGQNLLMLFLLICIVLFGVFDGGQFIYFQF